MSRLDEVTREHEGWGVDVLAEAVQEAGYNFSSDSIREAINTTLLIAIARELGTLNHTLAMIADSLNEEDK